MFSRVLSLDAVKHSKGCLGYYFCDRRACLLVGYDFLYIEELITPVHKIAL